MLLKNSNLRKGTLKMNKKGYGFVDVEDEEQDIFVHADNINKALNNYKEILVDENKNLIGLEMSKDNNNRIEESTSTESNSTSYNSDKSSNYEKFIGYSQYYVLYRYDNNSFTELLKYDYNKFNNLKFTEFDYEKMYCDYRGLYIGNYLYIITMDKGVQAINLSDLSYGDNLIFN